MSVYYSNNMPMEKIALKVGESCFWYQCVRVLYLHAVSRVKKNMLVILVFFRGSPLWSPRLSGILKMPSGTPACPQAGAEAGARRFAPHSGLCSCPRARRGALGHFQDPLQAPGIRAVIPSQKQNMFFSSKRTIETKKSEKWKYITDGKFQHQIRLLVLLIYIFM